MAKVSDWRSCSDDFIKQNNGIKLVIWFQYMIVLKLTTVTSTFLWRESNIQIFPTLIESVVDDECVAKVCSILE